jgi:hypothetical protein
MIIEASKNETTIVSNITVGEVIEMTVSEAGMAYAMSALSNMYNDPKLAVIREYFTNALDSHTKAGQTDPVLVSLPTNYNKMYVVQDFGVGMDIDTIRSVYSKYWESTKRDSNTQIGAFGLGAKSALAIANQFTLASVKDGVKVTVIVQKAGDGSGKPKMLVVSAIETDEPNGVMISIPIDDPYTFNNKAREFFRFVDPELVLVDGYKPSSVFDSVKRLEDISVPDVDIYVDLDNRYGTSYVIMGQVAYALTTSNIEEAAERLGISASYELRSMPVYFKVGIGDVNLTPNREGLLFDDKTNALIDSVIEAYLETVKKTAQEEIDAIESRFDVYSVAERWSDRLGVKLEWRGEKIRTKIGTAEPSSTIKRTSWDKSTHGSTYDVNVKDLSTKKIIVTGKPFDKYKRMANYITDYLAMMDINNGANFYFRENLDELDNEWVTENPAFIFEDFEDMIQRVKDHRKAEKAAAKALLPKELRDRPAKLEYPVLDIDDKTLTRTAYDAIPAGSFYIHANDVVDPAKHKDFFEGIYASPGYVEYLKDIVGEGATVVFISKVRSLESFKARTKDIHGLRSIHDALPDVQERINELMTDDVLRARNLRLTHTANRNLARLSPKLIAQILDDEVREQLTPADPALLEQGNAAVSLFSSVIRFGIAPTTVTLPELAEEAVELDTSDKYPLTELLGIWPSEAAQKDIIRYMNMVYTEQLTLVDA